MSAVQCIPQTSVTPQAYPQLQYYQQAPPPQQQVSNNGNVPMYVQVVPAPQSVPQQQQQQQVPFPSVSQQSQQPHQQAPVPLHMQGQTQPQQQPQPQPQPQQQLQPQQLQQYVVQMPQNNMQPVQQPQPLLQDPQQQQHAQPQPQSQSQPQQQPQLQQQIPYFPFQQQQQQVQQIWVPQQKMPVQQLQVPLMPMGDQPLLAPPTIPSLAKAEEKVRALKKKKKKTRREEVEISTPPEGLLYIPEFLTEEEERMIINWVYDNSWDDNEGKMKRRVKQYGYRFMHENGSTLAPADPVPEFLRFLIERMKRITGEGTFPIPQEDPDQILINEYLPGQGIKSHLDKRDLFDGIISSISLNSDCVIQLKNNGKVFNQVLQRRSYFSLTGEARNEWQHGIQGQTHDVIHGVMKPRDTRVSITFRRVLQ
eukprot:TRINITY_DN17856_c0_g1_i1.p1 TRINITY_DN17856_c0_g1~~TRINITY_DN17856_c0_g1_i1.p1  ORF type:complete len:422 (+),score=152.23 TRINITY_DN17856_c0_g1_i1:39-1304(+)